MNQIVTVAELQKNTSKITKAGSTSSVIITSHGKGRNVLLPYFEGAQEFIEDYLEAYEIKKNNDFLKSEINASAKSGLSELTI